MLISQQLQNLLQGFNFQFYTRIAEWSNVLYWRHCHHHLKTTITKTFMKASATRYSMHLRERIPKRHNLLRMFGVSLSNRRELKVSVLPQIPVLLFPALFSMDSCKPNLTLLKNKALFASLQRTEI